MEEITLDRVHNDLKALKKLVEDIRDNMIDVDSILSSEEAEDLDESIKRYKEGKTKSLEEIEKTPNNV